MEYSIKVLSSARIDISRIVNYFDEESLSNKKGDKFVLVIDEQLEYLKTNYNHFQVYYNNVVRLLHLKKLKYSIHYIVDVERKRVVVLAVFSMKEDPEKWEKRFTEIQSELGS